MRNSKLADIFELEEPILNDPEGQEERALGQDEIDAEIAAIPGIDSIAS